MSYLGYAVVENRHGLVVATIVVWSIYSNAGHGNLALAEFKQPAQSLSDLVGWAQEIAAGCPLSSIKPCQALKDSRILPFNLMSALLRFFLTASGGFVQNCRRARSSSCCSMRIESRFFRLWI